jgi:hypothetical protein
LILSQIFCLNSRIIVYHFFKKDIALPRKENIAPNNQSEVIKPIFIMGAPRSGTTLLYDILGSHNDLSFFTLNMLRAGIHTEERIWRYRDELLVILQNLKHRDKLSHQPNEATQFWSTYFRTYDYLTESDLTEKMASYYMGIIRKIQRISRKSRFINKDPQHCFRVKILNKIFPDAKFIHIIREKNAVACSTFAKVREEPPTNSYFSSLKERILPLLGEKYSSTELEKISEIDIYQLAQDVLVWKAREAETFGTTRYYEINYEDLVAEPHKKIREILGFCELRNYQEFEERLPEIRNENLKWEKML